MATGSLAALLDTLPQRGSVVWLGARAGRRAAIDERTTLHLDPVSGIAGDHYAGRSGKRQVTLIQAEHIEVLRALLGRPDIEATLLSLSFRDDAQPEIGLKVAAAEALRKAVGEASPIKLEPIMNVEVHTPEENLGAVIGDLRQRRAHINDVADRGERL